MYVNVGERFAAATEELRKKGILKNHAELCQKLDLSKGYMSQILSGKKEPSENVVSKFANLFPEVNMGWLLTGEGSMLLSDSSSRPPADTQALPLLPVPAMAGYMSGDSRAVMGHECEWYAIPAFHGADFLITVSGDSMYPRYCPGDIIACRRVADRAFLQWNRAYVIDTRQGVLVKRVRPGRDEEHITLVSENKDYCPFEISVDGIISMSLVVGLVRTE